MRTGLSHSECGKLGYSKSKDKLTALYASIKKSYEDNPKLCIVCGKKIPYEKRRNTFCSSSCSASYNNKTRTQQRTLSKIGKHKYCLFCGKEILLSKKFCNTKCQQDYLWEQTKREIIKRGCFLPGKDGEASRRLVRRFLLERDGCKCQICGHTEWMGKPIPLVVDHIDGNCENCSIDNFRLICGNCDMQTDTYKNKNNHKGRFWRAQRRREGKSY